MATTPTTLITNPNLWVGEYAKGVLGAMTVAGDSTAAGLFRIIPAIEGKVIVKGLARTTALRTGNLCSNQSTTNTTTMYDKTFEVTDYTVNESYCKDDLAATNYALVQQAGVWNKTFPQEVLNAMVEQIAMHEQENIERILWSGDTASTDPVLALQDGMIKVIKAYGVYDATLNPDGYRYVTPTSGTASVTPATVIAEINKVLVAVPEAVRSQPNFKLVVSPEVRRAYEMSLASNTALFNPFIMVPQGADPNFVGYFVGTRIPMYVGVGLLDANSEVIMAGNFSNDNRGNLLYATDAVTDKGILIVQDRQLVFQNQPYYDITMQFRMGWEVMKANEVVLYHN